MLLRRSKASPLEALGAIAGMQAQVPGSPYVGLWSRLDGFDPEHLSQLIESRRAVRASLMRSTIHLVTSDDCLDWWPVLAHMQARRLHSTGFGRNIRGMDMDELVLAGRAVVDEKPATLARLGAALNQRWPDRDSVSMAYAIRNLLAMVQVPPRGLWGRSGQATWAAAETWIGRPPGLESSPHQMIRRYLAAFGPASVADMQAWSGVSGLRPVVEELRPGLETFVDAGGRELFDLAAAPLPDARTPAPPRFLPEYDNALLAYDSRTRIIPPAHGDRAVIGKPCVLVDGFVLGTWKLTRNGRAATLEILAFEKLPQRSVRAVKREGERLLAFLAPEAAGTVEIAV